MKLFRPLVLGLFMLSVFASTSHAAIRLPAIVSSHMVLQRDTEVTLWGWADPKEKVEISLSWLEEDISLKADKEGKWSVDVKTTNNKLPQTITLKGKDSEIVLEDVLFGEVWLCSGQSNMFQPVMGYKGQPTFGALDALVHAKNSNLRLFTVKTVASEQPLDDVAKYIPWQSANYESVANFSAIAYYYGMQLQEILDVPVGLIHTSWGGSTIRAWMSKEVMSTLEHLGPSSCGSPNAKHHRATGLYNAMINPLIPYSIKGALWYQGESDRAKPSQYEILLPAMVNDWKERWGMEEFPFYYAQIAPYNYGKPEAILPSENTAFMRESMEKCLDLIPNSGMAVTLDIGDATSIHPPKKKPVADRLLYSALSQTYGLSVFDGQSPRYDSLSVKGANVEVWFKDAKGGLYAPSELRNFEVAGADEVFYPAVASIPKKNKPFVAVHSDNVPNPVAVRYAWRNMVEGTLFDEKGLPVSSFRTDDWDDATQAEIE